MKFSLVIGDIHTKKDSLDEVKEIMNELYYSQKDEIDEVIFLGDVINQSEKRINPEILEYITKLIIDILKTSKITICIGNHESISENLSTLNYLKYLGVNLIYHHGVIERSGNTIYLGHHFVDRSDTYYKDDRFKVKELSKKYNLCLTGHDHQYRQYCKNFINLGSIRRVIFSEVNYPCPKYLKLYSKSLKMTICDVKTAIPMIDVYSIEEALKIDSRTKIRLIFTKFEDFLKSVNKLKKLEDKFNIFRIKHDYIVGVKNNKKIVKKKTFEESFNNFLKTIKNKSVKNFIEECVK